MVGLSMKSFGITGDWLKNLIFSGAHEKPVYWGIA